MNTCIDCGSPISDEQNTCSMCYGDVGHGDDGYYEQMLLDEQYQEEERAREDEREKAREEARRLVELERFISIQTPGLDK